MKTFAAMIILVVFCAAMKIINEIIYQLEQNQDNMPDIDEENNLK